MQQNGDIYIDTYAGWYSVRDEAYYAEDETVVGEDNVRRGPQGTPVEWVEEKSYFFKLSAYQDRLLALYESQPDFIGPDSRRNEVISFVKGGLKDLSISRTTFDWGVKVPNDPEHVMYVWVDALTNYITGVGFPDESDANWRYWPADVHIIGKDIIRFHAVYWPAFLMSAGIPVQKRVYAHGFLFNRGEKMSKSVGNVVDPFNLADQYGVDQMRYFFLREVPFGQDGNYNHEAIVARINADLANDLGNLAQRSLSMIAKQLGGVLPEPGEFTDNDKAILAQADAMLAASRDGDGDAADPSMAERGLGRGRRSQPLFRGRGAVGAGQDRSGAAEDGAVCDRGSRAPGRDPDAAGDAGCLGQAARQPRHSRRTRADFAALGDADQGRARRCRRRSAYFRATSNRRRTERFASRCSSTATAIWIFRILPMISTRIVARARDGRHRPHRHDLDPGEAARRAARHRRAISQRLLLGRHPSASRRRGRRHSRRRTDRTDQASEGRGAGRGGAGLFLRARLAGSAGARLSRPYRRRPRNRPAAGDPYPRSR